jgi:DNA-binding CsgD family transcriptional regulator
LLIGRIVGAAREHSALSVLPSALVSLWSLEFRLGNWPQAEAASSEGARLAEETGQIAALPWLRGSLAVVEGALGRADASQENAERAREANLQVGTGTEAVLGWAAGLLANGSGRTEEAIEHLENAAREEEQRGFHDPTLFPWRPELIYAYVRAGRTVDAELMLSDFESLAEGTTLRWPRAAAARCRGLLADDDSFEPEFATALGWHQGLRMPFEQARTQLCLGERRIRARRRADARDPLRAALTTFERLGAATWAETARRELRATGLRIRSPQAEHEQRLTPRELEIALKVAEGLTNREVAASLFLSLKTVEHHLRIVFRKLDVRSRSQLAGLVAEHDPRLNAYPE